MGLSATSTQALRMKQQAQVAAQKQALAKSQVAAMSMQQGSNSAASTVDNFGESGKMSPAMEAWCKEQLRKLNGNDDLTLVSFCMTLKDPNEVNQYLSAYLGSNAAVSKFAAEFIARKGGTKPQESEWESAGNSKKGRKKKGVAASR